MSGFPHSVAGAQYKTALDLALWHLCGSKYGTQSPPFSTNTQPASASQHPSLSGVKAGVLPPEELLI